MKLQIPSKIDSVSIHPLGNEKPLCPHCQFDLGLMPKRKKKCVNCDEFYLVRTSPINRSKILIKERDAYKLELQWQAVSRLNAIIRDAENAVLFPKNGFPDGYAWQADKDIFEQILFIFKTSGDSAKNRSAWGLYRCWILNISEAFEMSGDYLSALEHAFQVYYLDQNGPVNASLCNGVPVETEVFDAQSGWELPTIREKCVTQFKKSGISEIAAREMFNLTNQPFLKLNPPVPISDVWNMILPHLSS
jgi:hypothetical protein